MVVILSCGSAVEMPWLSMTKGLVHGYLSGQAGARAVVRVLTGEVNPSGKLSETYPISYEDVASAAYFPGKEASVEYREGMYIGYRYFRTAGVPVLFDFGFGLSYTTFSYSNLVADETKATFVVKNTGAVAGKEIVQLYVSAASEKIFRPKAELKGFAKVFLQPGEEKEVTIILDDKAFRYFNVKTNHWEVEGGSYEIRIAASATDIRLTATVSVTGTEAELPYEEAKLKSYFSGKIKDVSLEEFENLLGHVAPPAKWDRTKELGYDDTLSQMIYARGGFARFLAHIMYALYHHYEKRDNRRMTNIFDMVVLHLPFRALSKMTGGALSMKMVDAILVAVNGHFLRGVKMFRKTIVSGRRTSYNENGKEVENYVGKRNQRDRGSYRK